MRHKLLSVLTTQAETTLAEFPRSDTTNIPVNFHMGVPPKQNVGNWTHLMAKV